MGLKHSRARLPGLALRHASMSIEHQQLPPLTCDRRCTSAFPLASSFGIPSKICSQAPSNCTSCDLNESNSSLESAHKLVLSAIYAIFEYGRGSHHECS